jgi:hypothetical protein
VVEVGEQLRDLGELVGAAQPVGLGERREADLLDADRPGVQAADVVEQRVAVGELADVAVRVDEVVAPSRFPAVVCIQKWTTPSISVIPAASWHSVSCRTTRTGVIDPWLNDPAGAWYATTVRGSGRSLVMGIPFELALEWVGVSG